MDASPEAATIYKPHQSAKMQTHDSHQTKPTKRQKDISSTTEQLE